MNMATPSGQPAGGATPPSPAVSAKGAHQAQFTPGPWRVWDAGICAPEHKGDGNVICLEPDHRMVASREAWTSNAHLIAAAPDLLAALVDLSDAVTLRSLRGRDHVPSMRGEQEAVQGARYAISKARGEVA